MKVVIQQVDMDSCLTALIQEVSETDHIVVVRDDATEADLADPTVLCIEAGGSGQVELRNFDHHNTTQPLLPAARQAFQFSGKQDAALSRLVDYVAAIDVPGCHTLPSLPAPGFPTLSDVFAGMRLTIRNPAEQLFAGLDIFRTVLAQGIDPFALMPKLIQWQRYIEAKQQNRTAIEQAKCHAEIFTAHSGLQVGFLETLFIGAPGALYSLGCPIAIAYSPRFGSPPVSKYTIAGNGIRVDHLLPWLNAQEPGWGGPAHGTIIASPRRGSRLRPESVKRIVQEHV